MLSGLTDGMLFLLAGLTADIRPEASPIFLRNEAFLFISAITFFILFVLSLLFFTLGLTQKREKALEQ